MANSYLATVEAYQEAIAGLYGLAPAAIREHGEGDIAAFPILKREPGWSWNVPGHWGRKPLPI